MSSDAPVTFLTQDAYDRLAAELEELSTTGREEIAKRIEAARDEGDLKENGGYHAAKDEQGKHRGPHPHSPAAAEERDGRRGARGRRRRRARHRRDRDRRRRRRGLPARQPRDRRRLRDSTSTARRPRSAPRSSVAERATKTSYTAPNGREIGVEIAQGRDLQRAVIPRRRRRCQSSDDGRCEAGLARARR